MPATIRAEQLLAHPPARVWRALTEPELLSRWLMPTTFRAELGARFTFDTGKWGLVEGEVLALEPERLLRISWKNPALDTTVTWRLQPEGEGTRLFLEHDGFDLDQPMQRFAFESMGGGWSGPVAARLAEVVASLA